MKTILLLLIMFFASVGYIAAQPPGLPPAPSQAPIDGGLSILAIAGGAYVVKKLKSKAN